MLAEAAGQQNVSICEPQDTYRMIAEDILEKQSQKWLKLAPCWQNVLTPSPS
jgi:hypothetical protein